ncbi:hypothetical protein [Bartonella sp. CB189]|uniref:hypothetical protein n=1 Tax=Bartonella sp. CB189 TaxID=3112254 RepID=UPI002F965919
MVKFENVFLYAFLIVVGFFLQIISANANLESDQQGIFVSVAIQDSRAMNAAIISVRDKRIEQEGARNKTFEKERFVIERVGQVNDGMMSKVKDRVSEVWTFIRGMVISAVRYFEHLIDVNFSGDYIEI